MIRSFCSRSRLTSIDGAKVSQGKQPLQPTSACPATTADRQRAMPIESNTWPARLSAQRGHAAPGGWLSGRGHQDVRRASGIGLRAASACPRQLVVFKDQADVCGPAFLWTRALRDHVPAGLGLLLVREHAESFAGPCPIVTDDGRQRALAKIAR